MTEFKKVKHFFIELDSLGEGDLLLPFDLYIFQPINGSYILDLPAGELLGTEKRSYLQKIISSNGRLAVSLKNKQNYLEFTGLRKEDVPSLDHTQHPLFQLMLAHRAEYEEYLAAPVNYLEIVRDILRNDDFSGAIKRTKAELYQFPFTKSPVVSLAHQLAIEYLNDSKDMNKTVSLSYCFAKLLGIKDQDELAHLVTACFFRDIGLTQVSYEQYILQDRMTNLERGFQKHPALSLFLLNKSNLKLEPQTMKIIMDHHERYNGFGFPNGKKENQIELAPQIIGLADHIVSFAEGQLTSTKTSYLKTFKALSNGLELTGMQHGHHPSLVELLIKIVLEFD